MFRAPCAHHQEVKLYYTASGIIKPIGVMIPDAPEDEHMVLETYSDVK